MDITAPRPPGLPTHAFGREWDNLQWAEAHPNNATIQDEAEKIQKTIRWIVDAFNLLKQNPFLSCGPRFKNANSSDIQQLHSTLKDAVPRTDQNKGLYSHLRLAGRFGHEIVKDAASQNLNPNVLNAACSLNDVGKLTGIFRYHLNDLISGEILHRIGVVRQVRESFPLSRFNIGPLRLSEVESMAASDIKHCIDQYVDQIQKTLTQAQEIFILADVCGKAKTPDFTEIQTFEEMEAHHMETRQTSADYASYIKQKALWPSEIYAYDHLPGLAEGWLKIYRRLRTKWKNKGADVDEIRKKIQNSSVL